MQRGIRWSDTYYCVCMCVCVCVLCTFPAMRLVCLHMARLGLARRTPCRVWKKRLVCDRAIGACLLMLTQHAVLVFPISC